MHRNHLSICGFNKLEKAYGYLVKNEIDNINLIINNKSNKKILGIIGGSKIDDKILLLENLSKKIDGIYIAGGLINSILKNNDHELFIKNITNNKAKIYKMNDGLATEDIDIIYDYYTSDNLPITKYFYDIGIKSLIELESIIEEYDIIFWNGPLGFIEDEKYIHGTKNILDYLQATPIKKTIICDDKIVSMKNETKLLKKIDARKRKEYEKNVHYSTGCHALLKYLQNKIEEKSTDKSTDNDKKKKN
jgi:phosphoglycerate kinase